MSLDYFFDCMADLFSIFSMEQEDKPAGLRLKRLMILYVNAVLI